VLVLVVRARTLIAIFISAINATDLPWRMRPILRTGEVRRCVRIPHIPGHYVDGRVMWPAAASPLVAEPRVLVPAT